MYDIPTKKPIEYYKNSSARWHGVLEPYLLSWKGNGKRNLRIFFERNFITKDPALIMCTDDKSNCKTIHIIAHAYMHINEEVVPSTEVIRLVIEAGRRKAAFVIGADTTANHRMWGNMDINLRGELLLSNTQSSK